MESKGPRIKATNISVDGAKTGISAKGDMDLEMEDVKLSRIKGTGLEIEDHQPNNNADYWYKKPIGIIALTVVAGLLLWGAKILIQHFFPSSPG